MVFIGNGFRPLSRYEWFPTCLVKKEKKMNNLFPSPLEAWVVSYMDAQANGQFVQQGVSVPSRGLGGFLHSKIY